MTGLKVRFAALLSLALAYASVAIGQSPQAVPAGSSPDTTTIRVRVNQVPVDVVVRDRNGNAIGNLTQDDFQIFDNKVPQKITSFRVDTREASNSDISIPNSSTTPPAPAATEAVVPARFLVYLFDDLHLQAPELQSMRKAVEKHLAGFHTGDRAALFTTSGRVVQDFTQDPALLLKALSSIKSGTAMTQVQTCPWMSYYLADLIDKEDRQALDAAISDTIACLHLVGPNVRQVAESMVRAAASAELATGDYQTRMTLNVLRDSVNRLAVAPGKRILVLASPGFLTLRDQSGTASDVMDAAVRSRIVINAVDLRGLWADPSFDASLDFRPQLTRFIHDAAYSVGDILSEFAYATGGAYFHNNDLADGFRRAADFPEYSYVLSFSPSKLKSDGKFHSIKVVLRTIKEDGRNGYTIAARHGYFAPREHADPKEAARQEMNAAMFSREELRELPITVKTQPTHKTAEQSELAVVIRVPIKGIAFQHADGRNNDTLTFASGIFDENGRLIQGSQRNVDLRLKDETIAFDPNRGLVLRDDFQLKPGHYLVRAVVRDPQGPAIGATSQLVTVE